MEAKLVKIGVKLKLEKVSQNVQKKVPAKRPTGGQDGPDQKAPDVQKKQLYLDIAVFQGPSKPIGYPTWAHSCFSKAFQAHRLPHMGAFKPH